MTFILLRFTSINRKKYENIYHLFLKHKKILKFDVNIAYGVANDE